MIEQFFDEAIRNFDGFEFDLDEIDDLIDWFNGPQFDPDELSQREKALYDAWLEERI